MSPEVAVAAEWRKVFMDPYVKQHLVLIAVDEAHCIPEWLVLNLHWFCLSYVLTCMHRSVDFRKAFKRSGELRAVVDVPFMAFTASAPTPVQSDIIHTLHLNSPVVVSATLDQPNIYLSASPI